MPSADDTDPRIIELLMVSQQRPLTDEETEDFTLQVAAHLVAIFMGCGLDFDAAAEKAENLLVGGSVEAELSDGKLKVTVTRGGGDED